MHQRWVKCVTLKIESRAWLISFCCNRKKLGSPFGSSSIFTSVSKARNCNLKFYFLSYKTHTSIVTVIELYEILFFYDFSSGMGRKARSASEIEALKTHWGKNQLFIQKFSRISCLRNVNFVKNKALKNVNFVKKML